jgi:hypothetical protein
MEFDYWNPSNFNGTWKRHTYNLYGIVEYGPISGVVGVPTSASTSARNRVISKFIEKCKSARSSIEGGQNLYELQQTLNSIRHPFKSLQKATSHYVSKVSKLKTSRRSRGGEGLRGLSNAITDTYLEYNFGIAPTVKDVSQLLADAGVARFDVVPISASASVEFNGSTGTFSPPGPPFISYFMNRTTKSKITYRYKGAIRTGVNSEGYVSKAQALRLTPSDFLPTVWNILPYSWMLDYVANVGEIIEALSFAKSNVSWGCVTQRIENTVTFDGNGDVKVDGLINDASHKYSIRRMSASGGNATFKTVSFSRDAMTSTDWLPTFEIKVPTTIKPYLNSLAVVIQNAWGQSRR